MNDEIDANGKPRYGNWNDDPAVAELGVTEEEWEATDRENISRAELSETQIVAQINAKFKAGLDDSARIRDVWRRNWKAYNNEYQDANLLPWQCDVTIPLISRAVNSIAASVKDAAVKGGKDWFDITGQSPLGDLVAPIFQKLVSENLDYVRFSTLLEPQIVSALLTCAPAMVVIPDTEVWPGFCRIENVDMRCLVRDPSGRDDWITQTSLIPWATVKREGGLKGWNAEKIQEMKSAAAANYDSAIQAFIADIAPTEQTWGNQAKTQTVLIDEYWGPLYDETGECVYQYAYCVIGNKEKLLFGPMEDPWEDGKSCYVDGDIMPRVFGAYSRSFVEDSRPIAELLNQLMRRMMDGLAYDVLRAFIIRQEDVTTQTLEDLQDNGLQPGTLIVQRQGDGPPLLPVDTGRFPVAAFQLYQILEQEFEKASGITSTFQGVSENRGNADITFGEIKLKQQNAERGLTTIAASWEDNVGRALVERLVRSIQLYGDLSDERVAGLVHEELQIAVNKAAAFARFSETEQLRQQAVGMGMQAGPYGPIGMPPMPEEEDEQVEEGTPEWEAAMEIVLRAFQEPMSVRVSGLSGVITKDIMAKAKASWIQLAMMLPGGKERLNTPEILKITAYDSGFDAEPMMVKATGQAFNPMEAIKREVVAGAEPPKVSVDGQPMGGI